MSWWGWASAETTLSEVPRWALSRVTAAPASTQSGDTLTTGANAVWLSTISQPVSSAYMVGVVHY